MIKKRLLMTSALALLATVAIRPTPAAAECRWVGTPPFCTARCPAGWYQRAYVPCWSGHKRYCCRSCGPANYGTPGCPYPRFDRRR